MNVKNYFQIAISVIIILILVSFYYNFLRQDAKEASDFDKNKKNEISISISENSNELNNIEYNSIDSDGNSYYLNAKKALIKLDEEKKNEVLLEDVTSIINLKEKGIIYIKSKNASYNKQTNDTFFYKDVEINYLDNSIASDNLDLIFSEKISNIYNNVVYKNKNLNLITDNIFIDMVSGDINMKMKNKSSKVKFTANYEFIN
mgnify:CR=1 FL=1|tara:strand:+ start:1180 stop:1788 length:609 start_codon:yes stop_codon:yes gene_type:complete